MALDEIVEALQELTKEEFSDDSNSDSKPEGFFCVEDSFSSSDVKVSVDGIGLINYPITNDVIQKLIVKSEKAKFGRKTETVLDTSYRDTQMIPASKLKVALEKQALENLLVRIGQDLHIGQSQLKIHLYNMLIYGPGQFFKRHRDTEKVPNMVATLVMVLLSPHKGGDLIIEHHGLNHRFFGSLNSDIIKCVTFYSDCYHEVKKVDEGFRVALTYNVELKSDISRSLVPVDENLKDAINNFFDEENDLLVYFLDHQYTENSLRWYMLKGADRICSKALLAVAKLEGYVPCLALADYQETWPEGCEEDVEKSITLYYWIDENNIRFDSEKIDVSEDKICFMKDTKEEFDPYRREEEGNMGNWAGNVDEWYHRSCVVLWRSTWSFIQGFKIEMNNLHRLTEEAGMETEVLQKLNGPSQHFFSSTQFWKDASVKKMILDIMMYVNDKETTTKILVKLNPSDVLNITKSDLVSWVSDNFDLETWKLLIKKWESSCSANEMLICLLPFLSSYLTKENKDLEIANYLFHETKKFFLNPRSSSSYLSYSRFEENKSENDNRLCSLLRISFQLGRTDAEDDLINKAELNPSISHFKKFKDELHPEQFSRIAGKLLLSITDSALSKIKGEKYIYSRPSQAELQEICSLFKTCVQLGNANIEVKIFNFILSKPAVFKPIFLAELIILLAPILNDSYYQDFKNRSFSMIQAELETLNRNPNDCSMPIQHPCNCDNCTRVQRFFSSKTEMQLVIPTAQHNRRHIYSYLNPLVDAKMPVKLETIRTGSPYKLTVTKLPKLLQDRQNFIQILTQCKNKIVQTASGVGEPAAKKVKTV